MDNKFLSKRLDNTTGIAYHVRIQRAVDTVQTLSEQSVMNPVSNLIQTIVGIGVDADPSIPSNKCEVVNDMNVIDTLNDCVGAADGEMVAIIVGNDMMLWTDGKAQEKGQPINLRASLVSGQPVHGRAVFIGINHGWDEYSSTALSPLCDLPKDVYNHLIGH